MTGVMVLGAGGVIGQEMLASGTAATFVKRTPFPGYLACDLSRRQQVQELLHAHRPATVINLAGENRVNDVDSGAFDDPIYAVNVGLPGWVADWCDAAGAQLIQVSTQGVFSGDHAPYVPDDVPHPITVYGQQKRAAELFVMEYKNWTVVRATFVLGVRRLGLGRQNPLEAMFGTSVQRQVNDRWFSVAFAKDVASLLWDLAAAPPGGIHHIGLPRRVSRYDIARLASPAADITAASDDDFCGPRRPLDTTWAEGSCVYLTELEDGIAEARRDWQMRCQS